MLMGRVIGNVWATRKAESLTGMRMLLVRPFTTGREEAQDIIVACDPLGAGMGETVLGSQDVGWQAAVVAIVDSISLADGGTFELGDSGERIPV